jgi:hypothetical protein
MALALGRMMSSATCGGWKNYCMDGELLLLILDKRSFLSIPF